MFTKSIRTCKKRVKLLERQFKYKLPYQLLIDGDLLKSNTLRYPVFRSIFNEFKLFVTACVAEKYSKSRFLRHCEIRKCKTKCDTFNCYTLILNKKNKNNYILVSGNKEKEAEFTQKENVPFLLVNGNKYDLNLNSLRKRPKLEVDYEALDKAIEI